MKKLITIALASCMAITGCVTIAACGGGADYNHTILFYSSQGDALATVTEEAIAAFEEKYPGWTVEHTKPGGYDEVLDKVRQDLTAGLQPDLAYCYADHVAQYIESGKVVDMDQYLTNGESYTYTVDEVDYTVDRIGFTEEEVENFIPGYLEEGRAKNFTGYADAGLTETALLTLPFVKSTELLYYNPDALKKLGYSEAPETWDDLWKMCKEARQMWPTCTPLGYDSEANWFITMAAQRNFGYTDPDPANHFLFVNSGAEEWLGEIAEYHDLGYFTTQQEYNSYTSGLFIKGPENGGLVFCIGSSGGASNQAGNDFTTEVAPIPGTMRDGELHAECISQGPSLVMLAGGHKAANPTEKQIMTFQFIKELLDIKFQAKFAKESGYNPMRTEVYEEEGYAAFLAQKDPETGKDITVKKDLVTSKAAAAAQLLTERFFTSPAFVGSSTARAQMTTVVQYAMLGQKAPHKALEDAYYACGGK